MVVWIGGLWLYMVVGVVFYGGLWCAVVWGGGWLVCYCEMEIGGYCSFWCIIKRTKRLINLLVTLVSIGSPDANSEQRLVIIIGYGNW